MYEFNPENVNNIVQLALKEQRILASKGVANHIVYSDLGVVQSYDEILPKIKNRYSADRNEIIDKKLLVTVNTNMFSPWQGSREVLVLDWLVSALVCLYDNAKNISPNNANYEYVKSPLYHLGEASELTDLRFGFPPTFSICGFIQSNATKQLEHLHDIHDWYDSGLFGGLISMIAQHWKLWSGNFSYPVPANYSCTMRKNLDDQIKKWVRNRAWAPSVAEQLIESRNTALIPRYSFTSKKVIYENLSHFTKREHLDKQGWLCRSYLASYMYTRTNRNEQSFFDGVQGELRFELIQFVLDNLIAFQRRKEVTK